MSAMLLNITPHLLERADAENYVGGPEQFDELCERWGLKAFRKAKGFSFFDEEEIKSAMLRKEAVAES